MSSPVTSTTTKSVRGVSSDIVDISMPVKMFPKLLQRLLLSTVPEGNTGQETLDIMFLEDSETLKSLSSLQDPEDKSKSRFLLLLLLSNLIFAISTSQLIPTIPANDRNRLSTPMVHTKNPNEDPFDDSISLTKSTRHEALNTTEGVLTRRMMKIQLTWKVHELTSIPSSHIPPFPCFSPCPFHRN
jgi:hypothetical protein